MNIETERLIIKPLTLDDAKRFSEYRDKEEVAMYQSWDEYPLNKAINRIEYCQKHPLDRKSTRLNSSHPSRSRMPSSA